MKKMSTILVVCALMFGLGFMGLNVTSCGSNSPTVTDDGDDAAKVAATTMGSAVPSEVVISSPTAELSEATLSLTKEVIAAEPGSDYMTKKQEFVALVAGEGECTFTLGIPTITPPDCYGPTVSYENHPDGGGGPNNKFPPYDLGFWNETEGDEACSAAKTNDVVSNIAARVDNMIKIMGAMACAGNKAGVDLPGVGEELDLTSTIADQVSVTGLAVSSAILERLADSDTNEVYRSTLSVATTIDENVETNTLVLTHIKTSEDGSTYQGKLRFKMSDEDGNCEVDMGQEGDPTPPDGMSYAGTILYEKSSAELLKYEVKCLCT